MEPGAMAVEYLTILPRLNFGLANSRKTLGWISSIGTAATNTTPSKGFLDWAWADVTSKPANTAAAAIFVIRLDIWASPRNQLIMTVYETPPELILSVAFSCRSF